MIMQRFLIGLLCSLFFSLSWAKPIVHPDFPSTRGELELKSTATATWLIFIDVYNAALYAEPQAQAYRLLDDERPFSLEIRYQVSLSKAQLIEGADVALGRQHSQQQRALYQQDVDTLHTFYQDVTEGDRFRLDIHPDKGLALLLNDKLLYQHPSIDFARYYVGLWLADNPLSDDLRSDLLNW